MKVVHLSTTDYGGAYKAAQRISQCLSMQGVESDVLVRSKSHQTDTVEVMNTPLKRILSKIRNGINLLFYRGEIVDDFLGADISYNTYIQKADIIIFHWVNSFVSAGTVKRLIKLHKPMIWVMHDMWIFTGGCHYDAYCGRYEQGCGNCPFLDRRSGKDISYNNLKRKQALYAQADISFVAISRWEEDCALRSTALKGRKVIRISNPVNTDIFRPLDRDELRKKYGISTGKVILFGADKALENPTKGFRYLVEALQYLNDSDYQAVCFGRAPEQIRIETQGIQIQYLDIIAEEERLVEWYNIADVFVAPSLQESFGYTVCEALSCGTPVAAFGVGGILDQIEHKRNGYLAKMKNAKDLADGIEYCVRNREKLTGYARARVLQTNSYEVVGSKYADLCRHEIK